MSSLRLLLVRHGQTESNVNVVLDSLPPGPPLTQLGRQQAAELAERLAAEPVTAVYASTALRARETAAPVAARHGLEVRVTDGLHEVFCGDFEGSNTRADIEAFVGVYRAWHAGDVELQVPGGESGRQLLERFLPVVSGIGMEHADGVVVLVSHSAALRLVGRTLASNVSGPFADSHVLPNCQWITLEADGDGWRCLDWAGTHPPQEGA
ncbi:MAG TPA: histidine phosphatase family protein [Pseudonocardiaceae bacterium]